MQLCTHVVFLISLSDMLQVGNVGLTPTEQISHFALWAITAAPLLAGTDIAHASQATLDILTAPELIEINQDVGLHGRIQGKLVGPATLGRVRAAPGLSAVCGPCDTGSDQLWDFIDPASGESRSIPPMNTPLHVRHRATGMFLDVPKCAHAPEPKGVGPALDVVPNVTSSVCKGANTLFQFHRNGTITTDVDGQCLNRRENGPVVQTYSCQANGKEPNGLWKTSTTGQISSGGKCIGVGTPPAPTPPAPESGGSELWVKQMSDGKRTAVLLLNLNDENATDLSFSPAMINVSYSSMAIRDSWKQANLGQFSGNFTAKAVPPHGVVVVTVTNADNGE